MNHTTIVSACMALLVVGCGSETVEIPQYDGAMLFQGYCASCHGVAGEGDAEGCAAVLAKVVTAQDQVGAFPAQQALQGQLPDEHRAGFQVDAFVFDPHHDWPK